MADKEIMKKPGAVKRQIRPLYRIAEVKGGVTVMMEMPGVQKKDVSISIENRELRVMGKRTDDKASGTYLIRERREGDFAHSFTIDETIDHNNVDAALENGLLTIKLQLKEEVKPRRIQVKTP